MLLVICVAGAIVVAVITTILAAVRAAARRKAALIDAAQSIGLSYLPKADKAFVKAWSVIKPLSKSGSAKHVMFGMLPSGTGVTVFEHQYAVSTGKSVHVVTHSVFAADTPDWPEVSLQRRGAVEMWFRGLFGRAEADEASEHKDGPPDFHRRWRIKTEDESFADLLLGEPLCAVIDESEKAPWWWFGGGKMAVLISTPLDHDTLLRGIDLLEAARAAIDPRLLTDAIATHQDP